MDVHHVTIYRWVQRFTPAVIDAAWPCRSLDTVLGNHGPPAEVTTNLAAPLLRVIDEVLFDAVHDTEQYANNRVENDHGRLKARLRPMRGLKRDGTASVVIRGHAFILNLRRGHYELGVNAHNRHLRVAAAFDELAAVI